MVNIISACFTRKTLSTKPLSIWYIQPDNQSTGDASAPIEYANFLNNRQMSPAIRPAIRPARDIRKISWSASPSARRRFARVCRSSALQGDTRYAIGRWTRWLTVTPGDCDAPYEIRFDDKPGVEISGPSSVRIKFNFFRKILIETAYVLHLNFTNLQ